MNEVEGIETVLSEVKEVDLNNIPDYDAILIGSPMRARINATIR